LAREAAVLRLIRPKIQPPLVAPRLVDQREEILVFEWIPWRPRLRPWRLPEEVAGTLGGLFAATGYAHGDCAAWNLLKLDHGWALVDWEEAHSGAPPFFDLVHYAARSHSHIGRVSRRDLLEGFRGSGWIGSAVRAYAAAAALEPALAEQTLRSYL